MTKPRMICALVLGFVTLSGCQTTRYVKIGCVSQEQLDRLKAQKPGKVRDQLTGEADEDLKKVAGRLVRVEAWGDGLITVLGGCIG